MIKEERYLWVIGGAILQVPLIEEANKLGLKTIVSDFNSECVAREYSDIFVPLDIFDIDTHLSYLKNNKDLNIVGVLAAGIDAPEVMAAMNEYLGLKGVSVETALLVKHKDKFRVELKRLGYPMPDFEIITQDDLGRLDEIFPLLRFPIIVKPTDNSGSRDMKIFSEISNELREFISDNFTKYSILLLESMWQGLEQTVECLLDIEGNFHRGFITDRKFIFENGFPVETGLVHPTELSLEKQEELYLLAQRVACDLNINIGALKLDTIYTDAGPRIIELTVRHSGGFDCQYLVPRSRGKNILKAAVLTAIGEKFNAELLEEKFQRYGVTGSLWPKAGTIQNISGIDEAKTLDGVEEIFLRYNEGDEITPYINCASRAMFIICTGKSRKEASDALQKAKELIKVEIS